MRYHLHILSFFLFVAFSCQQDEQPQKPNVVFILVDDLGWKDLSCYGSEFYETPQLDAFSQEAVRFTHAYSASPVCSPTRAAIMTGQNPARVNITDWIPGQNPPNTKLRGPEDLNELPLNAYTMAEAFKDNGYATFFAGKWHLGGEGYFPQEQGFDINKGGHHKGSPPGGYYSPYKNPQLSDGPEGEYLPDRLTNESISFIKQPQKQPFFLFLSYYTVHTPIQASKRHIEKYEQKRQNLPGGGLLIQQPEHDGMTNINQVNAAYASMVEAMDENVGRLLQTLKDEGMWENTIIVFTSDNGGLTTLNPKRKAPTAVRPLRAGKGWCYEGGIRVPLMIRTPDMLSNNINETPAISHDFFPTLADLAGLQLPQDLQFDGKNLSPLLANQAIDRGHIFWHYPHYHGSMWKPGAAIRQGKWKLVHFYEEGISELYDLSVDEGERNNLAESMPDKVKELYELLLKEQQDCGAQFPM